MQDQTSAQTEGIVDSLRAGKGKITQNVRKHWHFKKRPGQERNTLETETVKASSWENYRESCSGKVQICNSKAPEGLIRLIRSSFHLPHSAVKYLSGPLRELVKMQTLHSQSRNCQETETLALKGIPLEEKPICFLQETPPSQRPLLPMAARALRKLIIPPAK